MKQTKHQRSQTFARSILTDVRIASSVRTSSARITAARAATSASNTSVPRVLSDSTLLVDSLSAGDGVGAISGVVILLTLVAAFKTPQKRKGKKDNRSLNEKKGCKKPKQFKSE